MNVTTKGIMAKMLHVGHTVYSRVFQFIVFGNWIVTYVSFNGILVLYCYYW